MKQAQKILGCFDNIISTYKISRMNIEKTGNDASDLSRTPISEEVRREEAARLKTAYQQRKRLDPTLTQEKIADLCGWSGQSVVSQYMNGRIALNFSALVKFANILQVEPHIISPRLMDAHGLDSQVQVKTGNTSSPSQVVLDPIGVWDDDTPLGEDEVELPFFGEVELSAGQGSTVMLETNGRKLRFGKRTLQRKNIDPAAAGCVPVRGNSMEPVLPDGSTVGVDTANQSVNDGKMYAIDHDGQLRVKLLYRQPAGGLRLRSYNTEEHPDERYDARYVLDHIRIIGRVFWYSVLL
ncbi:MAG: LexA family transcriptional regulator [Pseudomonas helleri]|uniref:LexA family transcriptional regulator n=1 Tax=Pseudomonas helleri TaxID=1608996 RepID=UPI003F96D25F